MKPRLGFRSGREIHFAKALEQHWNRTGELMHDPAARAKQTAELWEQLGPKFEGLDARRVELYTVAALQCADRGALTDAQHEERNASTVGVTFKGFGAAGKAAAEAAAIKAHNQAHDPAMHALLNAPQFPGIGSNPMVVKDQLEQHQERATAAARAAQGAARHSMSPAKAVK